MTFIICIPIAILLWMIIGSIVNERKYKRSYQEYIDSIRVGDIFVPNFIDNLDDDPFKEIDRSAHYSKIILDIKKNRKGETWVKYTYLKPKEDDISGELTEEIHRFAKSQKRIKQSTIR